jgi:hypothetical protein
MDIVTAPYIVRGRFAFSWVISVGRFQSKCVRVPQNLPSCSCEQEQRKADHLSAGPPHLFLPVG